MLALMILWIVAYLSGLLFCKIGGEKETSQLWVHLTGFFFLFFLQGIVFFAAQFLDWNFTTALHCLEMIGAVVVLCCLMICRKEIKSILKGIKNLTAENSGFVRYFCLIICLFTAFMWMVFNRVGMTRNDAVVEIAATTIMTNTINEYHPFTHEPLSLGVILSRRIVTLPFWYAALSKWSGFSPVVTVQLVGTGIGLLLTLLAFAELGSVLVERNTHHTLWIVILMEFLYLSGSYFTGNESWRQLYYGYSGEVLTASVLVPGILTVLYRMLGRYLRSKFQEESLGIGVGNGLFRIGVMFGISLFFTTIQWGAFVVFLSVLLFGIMSLIIIGMKKAARKQEEEVWHK